MYSQRTIKNKILIKMRKFGLIKKTTFIKPMKVRTVIAFDPTISNIESQQHIYIMNKLSVKKNCKFDANKKSCVCGASLNEFLLKKC